MVRTSPTLPPSLGYTLSHTHSLYLSKFYRLLVSRLTPLCFLSPRLRLAPTRLDPGAYWRPHPSSSPVASCFLGHIPSHCLLLIAPTVFVFDVHVDVSYVDIARLPPLLRGRYPCRRNPWIVCVSTYRLFSVVRGDLNQPCDRIEGRLLPPDG